MDMHDVPALRATIDDLRDELSRSRVLAEGFRALYTRQAAEIEHLRAQLDIAESARPSHRLHLVDVD